MSEIIKIKCNGVQGHVNEIDLENALRTDLVLRDKPALKQQSIPERLVFPCRFCTDGKVIVTRAIIQANLQSQILKSD